MISCDNTICKSVLIIQSLCTSLFTHRKWHLIFFCNLVNEYKSKQLVWHWSVLIGSWKTFDAGISSVTVLFAVWNECLEDSSVCTVWQTGFYAFESKRQWQIWVRNGMDVICNYCPHSKHGKGNVFTGVCLLTEGGGTPWSVVPGPFWGGRGYPLVLPLVLSKVLTQVLPGGGGYPQSCHWSSPKSCSRSFVPDVSSQTFFISAVKKWPMLKVTELSMKTLDSLQNNKDLAVKNNTYKLRSTKLSKWLKWDYVRNDELTKSLHSWKWNYQIINISFLISRQMSPTIQICHHTGIFRTTQNTDLLLRNSSKARFTVVFVWQNNITLWCTKIAREVYKQLLE